MSGDIAEAKRTLQLPALLHRIGLGEHAKKSARCPFHDDKNNSFSIFRTNGNGSWRWKCFACNKDGDEIDLLAMVENLSKGDAIRRYCVLAGVNGSKPQPLGAAFREAKAIMQPEPVPTKPEAFNWQFCIDALNSEDLERLSKWRGYKLEFCHELRDEKLIGVHNGLFAFPVRDAQNNVVGTHVRAEDGKGWFYHPKRTGVTPLLVAKLIPGEVVHVFESTWDGLAFLDVSGERSGVVIARGSSNAKQIAPLISECSYCVVWTQNDEAGAKFEKDLVDATKCPIKRAKIPEQHKDLNDWTRAGASSEDLLNAILTAESLRTPTAMPTPEKPKGDTLSYVFVDLETVTSQAVTWIEEPFLARGELHALMGLGGSYKGTLTLTWAAEFSRRGEHVILLSAEDSLDKKIKPLLEAAAADMRFIRPMKLWRGADEEMLMLPDQIPLLEDAILKIGAKLVVIDPLVTYIPATLNTHKDHDMKRALTPLSSLAQRTNTTIVGIFHEKKDRGGSAKLWAQGSLAFGTTCRVQMAMHKNSEEEVTLEVVKSNIGREGAGILFRADIVEIAPGIEVPRLTRAGQAPLSIQELVNGQHDEEMPKTLQAAILILDILEEEGEQKQSELFERVAEKIGLKVGTIYRKAYWGILQEEMLVDARRDGFQGKFIMSRSDRERPERLRSMTAFRDPAPKTQSQGHGMDVLPSVVTYDLDRTLSHGVSHTQTLTGCQAEWSYLGELSAGVQAS